MPGLLAWLAYAVLTELILIELLRNSNIPRPLPSDDCTFTPGFCTRTAADWLCRAGLPPEAAACWMALIPPMCRTTHG